MFRNDRRPRRMLAASVCAIAAVLALSGCAAGKIAQTAEEVAAVDGGTGNVGGIGVRNVLLQTTAAAEGYAKGSSVPVLLVISNASDTTDTLTKVTSPAAASVAISGKATVPDNSLLQVTGNSAVKLTLQSLSQSINFGQSIPVTFSFATAGSVTVNVPIEIPAQRTTGRPSIVLQPSEPGSLWDSQSSGSQSGSSQSTTTQSSSN